SAAPAGRNHCLERYPAMSARTASVRRLLLLLMVLMAAVFFPASAPSAHEVRPAYLQINEIEPGRYQFLWRTPVLSRMTLPVELQFPEDVGQLTVPSRQELPDSIVERGVIGGTGAELPGKRITFPGLQATVTDVLVRAQLLDGTHSTTLVRPSQPWVEI